MQKAWKKKRKTTEENCGPVFHGHAKESLIFCWMQKNIHISMQIACTLAGKLARMRATPQFSVCVCVRVCVCLCVCVLYLRVWPCHASVKQDEKMTCVTARACLHARVPFESHQHVAAGWCEHQPKSSGQMRISIKKRIHYIRIFQKRLASNWWRF